MNRLRRCATLVLISLAATFGSSTSGCGEDRSGRGEAESQRPALDMDDPANEPAESEGP
jgi:hypothetical protein